ncbi:MAG TPA: GlsB/YeaQ/YmgE family stress response membrane protein [Thermoleophilaceae bacterium]|nr:GlsB/YeaQ/YmgE family stress response membrane protein [Thermoleophilaceae bacterium]
MIGAIILGLLAGFIAKALMPGHDPGGFFVTILLGLAGALVGFFLFTELLGIGDNEAFDLGGLVGAIIGTMILLGIWRLVAGRDDRPRRTAATP